MAVQMSRFHQIAAIAAAAGALTAATACSGTKAVIAPDKELVIDVNAPATGATASPGTVGTGGTAQWQEVADTTGGQTSAVTAPKALVYTMSGPYADNVPVNLSASGRLVSFPAPTDLSTSSRPVELADGWWLDNRGIGENTAFTTYTYAEYSAMTRTPSPDVIMAHIIPGARVTRILRLPISHREALADTAALNRLIARMTATR